jgi:O-antigen/teichoic acid export membrane protein
VSADGSLAGRTVRAGRWRLASSLVQGGLQFGVGVLLARLLPPEDFGLVVLALVVVGLGTMASEMGLTPAIVQRRPLTGRHLRVAFTAAVAAGCGAAALLWALAPAVGALVRVDGVAPVLRALSVLFVAAGAGATARGLLQRTLDFRALFRIEAASFGLGYAGIAVVLAVKGFGVWSLVAGSLAQAVLASALALHAARHPLRPLVARRELGELLGFGAGVSLTHFVNYVARNGDHFVLGRWLGPAALGLYSRAYNLMALPLNHFGNVIGTVLFPALSEIAGDRERVRRGYLLGVQLTALLAAPVMAGMMVAAPHLVVGLYGPAWAGTVLPLQLLCAVGVLRTVSHLASAVALASGQVYAELRRQGAYAVLVVGGSIVGAQWGVAGVAVAVGGAIAFSYLAMAQLALRIVGGTWRAFAAAHLPGLLLAGAVGAATLGVRTAMERSGAGSLAIFVALAASSAAVLLPAVYLLPAPLRPVELFSRLEDTVARLPFPLRPAVARAMRLA